MRKPIIAANWKMHMTLSESASYLDSFLVEVADENRVEIVLIPPFTALSKLGDLLSDIQNIKLGAQNMHPKTSGAFTGEISPFMLRELYVRYVVLGHSERRTLFGESDETVNQKAHAAMEATLRPIVCIGETLEQRDAGAVEEVLETQLRGSLAGFDSDALENLVIAYEPVWAIGTGRTATPDQAQEAHAFIRKTLAVLGSEASAERIRIQYGGSVKPDNAESLMSQPDIDGALVGGASLDPHAFSDIIKATSKLTQ